MLVGGVKMGFFKSIYDFFKGGEKKLIRYELDQDSVKEHNLIRGQQNQIAELFGMVSRQKTEIAELKGLKEQKLEEQYCKMHGWEKVEGYKLDTSQVEDDWEYMYVSKEELKNRLTDCTFWQYTEEMENVYEDIDQVIEYIEEHFSVPDFEAYKNSLGRGKA